MDKQSETILHFNKICRICLDDPEDMYSFTTEFKAYILDLVAIKVEIDDGLPQGICKNCSAKLHEVHSFKRKIKESDEVLRSYLQNLIKEQDQQNVEEQTAGLIKEEEEYIQGADLIKEEDEYVHENVELFEEQQSDLLIINESSTVAQLRNERKEEVKYPQTDKLFEEQQQSDLVVINNSEPSAPVQSPNKERKKRVKNPEVDKALAKLKASAPLISKTLCHLCNKNFSCVGQLTRHLKTHIGIRSYVCKICGKAYTESGNLRKHVTATHSSGNKPYDCHECPSSFGRRTTLIRHMRTHVGEKHIACETCHKFYPLKSINKHKKKHHSFSTHALSSSALIEEQDQQNIEEQASIKEEEYVQKNAGLIKEEDENVELFEEQRQSDLVIINNLEPSQSPNKERKERVKNPEVDRAIAKLKASAPLISKTLCHLCNKNFSCAAQLTRHLKTHIGIRSYTCEICGKAYMESGSLRKHVMAKHSGRKKPYNCRECSSGFDRRTTLISHMRTHTGEKPFGCEICHTYYHSKSYLNRHKKMHTNPREKPFICEICSKSFLFKDRLKAHLITHSNSKPFQCTICDKTFSVKRLLTSHIQHVHKKEKNFMCQICGQTFVRKHDLNEHLIRHSGKKKEPKHSCSICNKKYLAPSHLKLHIRSEHTGERPYPCEHCNKTFVTKHRLKIHERSHTGEKPYDCKYCPKRFTIKAGLIKHTRVHTGEKPYVCPVCKASFSQLSTLRTHSKRHSQ